MPEILVGNRYVEERPLRRHEAAFIYRRSEREIHNMIRRGALPVVHAGRRRLVDPLGLADLVADDELATEMLAALLERRIDAPRAPAPEQPAPSFASRIERL